MWPAERTGEVPRYFYAGELTGDANFVQPEEPARNLADLLADFLEIVRGEAPPRRLYRPQTGVVDEQGRILVTDLGKAAVFVFDEASASLAVWEQADGNRGFISPVGIALGPDGQVLVADAELGIVARLDREGNALRPIGEGQLLRPTGLAFDRSGGRVFVTDTRDHKVKVFDLEGRLLAAWGGFGEGPGQLNYPTHLALAGERLYVSDTLNARIQVFSSADGRWLGQVGRRGLYIGNLVRPKGIAVDGEGNLYVIESYFDHLLVFNRSGDFLMPIGGVGDRAGRFHLPAGVWTDARNRVFIADTLNARVPVFQYLGGGAENAE
ncbi:MAG: 6-bladed beta-propeller [Rhodocyclaceae bacterium]|nr:6-bladed beta-propeller [Rhodocyclaceae bacterium]